MLALSSLDARTVDAALLRQIGLTGPLYPARIGQVFDGAAAQRAGLQEGDQVLSVDGVAVVDGAQLRELMRASVTSAAPVSAQSWRVQRQGSVLTLQVTPELGLEGESRIGRIGAYVGAAPEMVTLRHGPLDGLWLASVRTSEVAGLTLRLMGQMVLGQASLKNLSGPLTMADYAGKSASLGLASYLVFLAVISVGLGVLNLLPLPILDGGHLMYYLWEAITGRAVSDVWLERLQRGGVAVLVLMMSIALFNDIGRLFG
jgi:regulator of sigma E protease